MTPQIEALKLALEALEGADWYINQLEMIVYSVDDDGTHENRLKVQQALNKIKEALAQPEKHQDWCASLTQMLMSMPPKPAPCNCKPPQRTWVGLMRGVRVEGDNVIISVHYGNDAARQVCGALIEEMST